MMLTAEQLLERENKLTPAQRSFLQELRHHSVWYYGCGWVWQNRSTTTRLAEALVKRGLAVVRQSAHRGGVEYLPTGSGQSVYIAVGPYGWAKHTMLSVVKRACAERCTRPLRGGESYDVFLTADPKAYVDDMGRMVSDGSAFIRVAGRGQFMNLNSEQIKTKEATPP